jgi:hypothetical protein
LKRKDLELFRALVHSSGLKRYNGGSFNLAKKDVTRQILDEMIYNKYYDRSAGLEISSECGESDDDRRALYQKGFYEEYLPEGALTGPSESWADICYYFKKIKGRWYLNEIVVSGNGGV